MKRSMMYYDLKAGDVAHWTHRSAQSDVAIFDPIINIINKIKTLVGWRGIEPPSLDVAKPYGIANLIGFAARYRVAMHQVRLQINDFIFSLHRPIGRGKSFKNAAFGYRAAHPHASPQNWIRGVWPRN